MTRSSLLLALAVGACAGRDTGRRASVDPTRPVTIGEWCTGAARVFCGELGGRCASGDAAACEQGFVPSCVSGRDAAAASGRTQGDLDACAGHLQAVGCTELVNPAQLVPCQLGL